MSIHSFNITLTYVGKGVSDLKRVVALEIGLAKYSFALVNHKLARIQLRTICWQDHRGNLTFAMR